MATVARIGRSVGLWRRGAGMELKRWLEHGVEAFEAWTRSYEEYAVHPAMEVAEEPCAEAFAELTGRLRGSYPFFHPCYAGQMLKPPHPAAVAAHLAAMLVNSNNHALDGGPATSAMEEEAVGQLAAMVRLETPLGHLTSNGTVANLEALFVARESHPGRSVAVSSEAHYTHARMCHLLGVQVRTVPVDAGGRMDVAALEQLLASGDVGTVVATAGTTALGAVDPVHRIVTLARRYGARVHVDAAYGGFFTLLAEDPLMDEATAEALRAVGQSDSVVIDPHKHGLQPYGCGAVLFADPTVARFYRHDSPYTYFTSARPHLGEISLECSRSGAAAAALWLTLRLLPLTRQGLGGVLAAGRRAALRWAGLIDGSPHLEIYQRPELDILTYYPRTEPAALSRVGAASQEVMRRGMEAKENPVFLSVARVGADAFARRHPHVVRDGEDTHILRSVLMKPESELYVDRLHRRVAELARPAE